MARFIEIEEKINPIIKILPKDFYKNHSVKEILEFPDDKRRIILHKTSVINIDEIIKVEPCGFTCETNTTPIIYTDYKIILSNGNSLEVKAEEYEVKLKRLLINRNFETTL